MARKEFWLQLSPVWFTMRSGVVRVPRKLRELRADLRAEGFVIDHQTGSHQVWKHPLIPGISANLGGRMELMPNHIRKPKCTRRSRQ